MWICLVVKNLMICYAPLNDLGYVIWTWTICRKRDKRGMKNATKNYSHWKFVCLSYQFFSTSLLRSWFLFNPLHSNTSVHVSNGEIFISQVNFREIPSHVLQKVCMYFCYKVSLPFVPEVLSQTTIQLSLN